MRNYHLFENIIVEITSNYAMLFLEFSEICFFLFFCFFFLFFLKGWGWGGGGVAVVNTND